MWETFQKKKKKKNRVEKMMDTTYVKFEAAAGT